MKDTISGKNKIQQICDQLKKETLDPAKQEASEIIENAHLQATEIIDKAKSDAQAVLEKVEKDIQKKKEAFDSALAIAAKQGVEALKQQIQSQLFNPELQKLMQEAPKESQLISRLIEVVISALEKEGLGADLSVSIGNKFDPHQVTQELSGNILSALREKEVQLGGFASGMQVKVHKNNVILDFSDSALTDLISQFVRRDFRNFFFEK